MSSSTPKLTPLLLFSYLTLSLLLPPFSIAAKERCHPQDKKALLQINKQFGNILTSGTSWAANSDCCKGWYGVTCDSKSNRVTSLVIQYINGISGSIPDAVGDLPYLQNLIFHKLPNITGSIPLTVTKLKYLQYLWLDWTNLTGPIPESLSQLKNVNYINLGFNKLTGPIPSSLSQLPKLQALFLDRNMLSGSIPESFGSFKQSNFYLKLSHNQLSGQIPRSLGKADLGLLYLARNKLTGDASFLFTDKLVNMDLSRNMLSFNLTEVKLASSLIEIDLNHNEIFGSLPAALAGLPQLQMFNVSYNRLCGRIPSGGQMDRFDQSSYIHNRCLCGTPLPPCK